MAGTLILMQAMPDMERLLGTIRLRRTAFTLCLWSAAVFLATASGFGADLLEGLATDFLRSLPPHSATILEIGLQ